MVCSIVGYNSVVLWSLTFLSSVCEHISSEVMEATCSSETSAFTWCQDPERCSLTTVERERERVCV
jgi:hypothetical protein